MKSLPLIPVQPDTVHVAYSNNGKMCLSQTRNVLKMKRMFFVITGYVFGMEEQHSLTSITGQDMSLLRGAIAYNEKIAITVLKNEISSEAYQDILAENLLPDVPLITTREFAPLYVSSSKSSKS